MVRITLSICTATFNRFAMCRFGSEFALHLLNKIQIADCDRFRPKFDRPQSLIFNLRRVGLNGAVAIERLERLEPTDEESLFGVKMPI
jgi:hypothetical protein